MGTKSDDANNASTIGLTDIYESNKGWLESMAHYTPVFYDGFSKMTLGILTDGAIPRYIKELIVACVYAWQGFAEGAITHMKNAIDLGTSDEEIAEMLSALVLSRGPRAYVEGLKVWKEAGGNPKKAELSADSNSKSFNEDNTLKYFEEYYGASLPHIRVLAENKHLDVLQGYYEMRRYCIADMILPRKFKEFLYIAVNSADMRPEAMELHVKGACAAGVTKEEILEAMLLGIMAGGVASWLYASKVYEDASS